jgi:GTPase involved in cell partitioning and DNA repair
MQLTNLVQNTTFVDSIVSELNSVNQEIVNFDEQIANLKFKLVNKQLELDVIEDRVEVEVSFDSTLKNERQRDAALASQKRKDSKWVSLATVEIPQLKDEVAKQESARAFQYRKYQTLLAYVRALNNNPL